MNRLAALIALIALATLPGSTAAQEPTVYDIALPSGGLGQIIMTITAGEAAVAAAVMVLAVISLFRALQQSTQAAKAK